MKTVIMAGGMGTRISSVASNIPKPMIRIGNKPILEYEINCLSRQGFTDIIITVSHLGQIIMDYFGDGSAFGTNIEYYNEATPLGNAGALFKLKDKLTNDFLLLNADTILDVDLNRFVGHHKKKGGLVTLFTHPNNHPFDSGLIVADKNGAVSQWLTKEDERSAYYQNRVNAGLHIVSPRILDAEIKTEKIDLDRQLLKPLSGTGKMFVYDSPEYLSDMGTPERFVRGVEDVLSGKINRRNLKNKQKAIFLDRDGTINADVGFLTKANQFSLIAGVSAAIKTINASDYLAIVITNQPVIARGEVTHEELHMIHNKMETLLGQDGAYLNAIYYCPHHPDKGFPNERSEYKIKCECRKPNPGLLLQAAADFNIDLSESWMVGNSKNDINVGIAAGCKTILLGTSDYGQTAKFDSLFSFSKCIIDKVGETNAGC